jgi:hypothetical protein
MMHRIERIFTFYVFSNIHVALSASCLVMLTLNQMGIEDCRSVLFVFCGTVAGYNFIRAIEFNRLYPSMTHWIRSSVVWVFLLNVIMIAGLIYATLQFSWRDLAFMAPFFLLTLFYAFPFKGRIRGLRNLPGVKLFLISAVWAGVTVLFPVWANNLSFDSQVWTLFWQRFLLIFAITIPFDIRDLQLDNPDLSTLPQSLGVGRSKFIAVLALIAFFLLFYLNDFSRNDRAIGFSIALISAVLILRSEVHQNRFYSSFWVEGIPILWFVLTAATY